MKTIATGFFNGEKVRIASVWFNARTGSSYCEVFFGDNGWDNGLRTQFENISSVQFIVEGK